MIPSSDAESGEEVVRDTPDECWAAEGRAFSKVEAIERNEDYESCVEPVDLLVPVVNGDGLVLDMCTFRCRCARGSEQARSWCRLSHD